MQGAMINVQTVSVPHRSAKYSEHWDYLSSN
jgi:hypothetical protein